MSIKVYLLVVFAFVAFSMDVSDDEPNPIWMSEDDQGTPEFHTPEGSESDEQSDEDDFQFSEEEDTPNNPMVSDDDDAVVTPQFDMIFPPGFERSLPNPPIVNETTITRIAMSFIDNVTGVAPVDLDQFNLSMEQMIFLFGQYALTGYPGHKLMSAPVPEPCVFEKACPNGVDTYDNLVMCVAYLANNCTGFENTIEMLNLDRKKYLCPEHFVDLSGYSDDDFPVEVFKNRMKYIRVSIPQKKKFDDKCLENSGRFAVKKISLNCKELQVKTCEIEDKSTLKEVPDKAELDRICSERKLEVRDLRSQELSAQMDDFILNSNASAVCLVIDKQQLSELSEYLKIARLEAIVHVPVKLIGDFVNQIAKPDFAVSKDYHYAIFDSGNFIGSGGVVSIADAGGKLLTFGLTAKHVVKSATSIWMCNSIHCFCASVIVPPKPIKGHQSDIAFLYAPEFEKLSTTGMPFLVPLDEKSKIEVIQIDGFLQHNRKYNPTAVTVRYSRASTEIEDYKYLLLEYHHSMQEGLSGSLITSVMVQSRQEIIGVFTGTWNKYFWESASRGMMAWVTKEDIEYLLDYNIQRNPSCKGSGSIIGERYRDVVADKVDSWVAAATRYLREGN